MTQLGQTAPPAAAGAPSPGNQPGWRHTADDRTQIAYWDGTRFTAFRHWDGTEWVDSVAAGWWQAADHRWYPPELRAAEAAPLATPAAAPTTPVAATTTPVAAPAERVAPVSGPRIARTRVFAAVGVALGAVAVAGGAMAVLGGGSGGLSGKTPAQVLDVALAAARAQGAAHLSQAATGSAGGVNPSEMYDVGRTEGRQVLTGGSQGNATLLVLPGAAYLRGDAAFLRNALGFTASAATQYASKWISFGPNDPGYQQLVAGDTIGSALTESTPSGSLALTPTRTIAGQQVVGVSGGLPPAMARSGATGTVVLYVSTTAPYLPVEVVESGALSGQHGTATISFSSWGEPIVVSAPPGAVPFASLPASVGASPRG